MSHKQSELKTLLDAEWLPEYDSSADFEAKLIGHFEQLKTAGLSPNHAASYALKWTTASAKPAQIDSIKDVVTRGSYEAHDSTCIGPRVETELLNLFSSGDALYISLILYFTTPKATTVSQECIPCPAIHKDAAPTPKPLVDLHHLSNFYASVFVDGSSDGSMREEIGNTTLVQALQELIKEQLPTTFLWRSTEAQAAIFASLLLLPHMAAVAYQDVLVAPLLDLFTANQDVCSAAVLALFTQTSSTALSAAIFAIQQFITLRLYCRRALDASIAAGTKLLAILHSANAHHATPVSHEAFYNDVVNSADFDLREDWMRSRHSRVRLFSFCRYPFMYGPAAKAQLLKLEATTAMTEGMMSRLLGPGVNGQPYLVLHVRRGDELMRDSLQQIRSAMAAGTLKRPLKVKFVGEQGVDEGGVSREFFQLIVKECFAPNYGMFVSVPGSNVSWFRASALPDLEQEFELVGVITGLAIYNAHILNVSFAPAIYCKILCHDVTLEALREVEPQTYSSLKRLLAYPADQVEADMALTFQVEHEQDFCVQQHDLVSDGANVNVTDANRCEFVERYVRFLLVDRVEQQFGAFKRGFKRVCDSEVLTMFSALELEQVVCGAPNVDFKELDRTARYDGGYSRQTDVVTWFWEIVSTYNDMTKRALLQFVTGCERVPIGGLANLSPRFVIAKNGGHSDRLPTSHTCFNALLLPEYHSKSYLENRLALALKHSHGFGLM